MGKNLKEIWPDSLDTKLNKLIESSNRILDETEDIYIPEELYQEEKSNSKYEYDPDSSPVAWKYYELMYKKSIKINPSAKIDITSNKCYRICGLFNYEIENDTIQIVQTNYGKLVPNTIALAGDCVFNFNDKKQKNFDSVVCKMSPEVKKKYEICKKMHHSPYNFSIMPVTGGMQLQKGRNDIDDRPDFFFFKLCELYKNSRNIISFPLAAEMSNIQKIEIRNKIKEIQAPYPVITCFQNSFTSLNLYDFLMTIGSFKQYTEMFYHLDSFVTESMCEFGNPNNNLLENFEEYLNLAIDYWNIQRKYYEQIESDKLC